MKPILFVCVHNAGRSQMAEAFFNHLARERGLLLRAESAGTAPGESVNEVAVEAMQELEIDMSAQRPRALTSEMVQASDRVITMGCGVTADACPAGTYLTEDWGLPDPHGKSLVDVRPVRDAVRAKVETLLAQLGD